MLARRCAWAVLLLAGALSACSQAPQARAPLPLQMELLRDPAGRLSLADVMQAQPALAWQATPGPSLSLGHSRDVIWLRLHLPARGSADAEHWLVAGQPFLDDLQLFTAAPGADAASTPLRAGDHVPVAQRPTALREAVFPVQLGAVPSTHYLRVQSTSALTLNLALWSPPAYAAHAATQQALQGLLQGLMLTSAIISLLAGLWLRRAFFFIAAAYVLATGALHAVLAGYDQLLLYPQQPWLADHVVGVLGFGVALLSILFSLSYLQPQAWYPRFTRALQAMGALLGVGTLVSLVGLYPVVAPWLSRLALGTVLMLTLLFLLMLRQAGPPRLRATLLLAMFLPSLLAAALQALRNLGWLPASFWTTQLWGLTAFLQMPFAAVVVLLQMRDEQRRSTLAERREREQQDFLDMMAHELRTPLAVLGTALANIELRTDPQLPDMRPRFRRATAALARLNTLVDNALADHRLRDTPLQLQLQPVRPSELAARVQQRLLIEAPHEWRLSLPADDSPVLLDPAWLDMAVLNLLDNAVKYSPAGGVVALHIERRLGPDGERLCLAVQDGGPGMATEVQAHLFDRFYRAPSASNAGAVPGVGLGLYLVAEVARRHGGRVQVDSAPGRGSRFTIELPARRPSGEPRTVGAAPQTRA